MLQLFKERVLTEKNKLDSIYENDNYIVKVVDGTYHVINKYTDVVEREDPVWPSAVQAAKFFDVELKELEQEQHKAPVVSIN